MGISLSFVQLTTADWAKSVAWYSAVLGLQLKLRDDVNQYALFETPGGRLALKAGVPQPDGVLLAFQIDDLDAELTRLRESGVLAVGEVKVSTEGYRRALVRDPDGYLVSLFEMNAAE
jgi:predicted enzyme related to lactoylglutathione lyase